MKTGNKVFIKAAGYRLKLQNVNIQDVRIVGAHESSMLADLIRDSYLYVAERFNLTSQNCPKHPSNCTRDWVEKDLKQWYEKMGFVEQEIKTFPHLPFKVSLLAYTL